MYCDHVTIGNNCWIGANSVIGAGSVVTKDIPANCVAAAIPARCSGRSTNRIRSITTASGPLRQKTWRRSADSVTLNNELIKRSCPIGINHAP